MVARNPPSLFGPLKPDNPTASTEPTPSEHSESHESESTTSTSSNHFKLLEEIRNPRIRLQVGDRIFTTYKDTLMESEFFQRQLSGRWDKDALPDRSWFYDGSPMLFEHILQYLRRGVFPLFFDLNTGHNHHLYQSLLEEARYLQIPRLQTWLEKKCYLKAVSVKSEILHYAGQGLECRNKPFEDVGGVTSREFYLHFTPRVVPYLCPFGIRGHRGNSAQCWRDCRAPSSRAGRAEISQLRPDYDILQNMNMVVVKKTVTVRDDLGKGWLGWEELEEEDDDPDTASDRTVERRHSVG